MALCGVESLCNSASCSVSDDVLWDTVLEESESPWFEDQSPPKVGPMLVVEPACPYHNQGEVLHRLQFRLEDTCCELVAQKVWCDQLPRITLEMLSVLEPILLELDAFDAGDFEHLSERRWYELANGDSQEQQKKFNSMMGIVRRGCRQAECGMERLRCNLMSYCFGSN